MAQIIIDYPPNRNQSAEKLWCYIAIDKDGNESPCGMMGAHGWMAMMSSEWRLVEKMRPAAVSMARQTPELRIVLRQYSEFTDLETL